MRRDLSAVRQSGQPKKQLAGPGVYQLPSAYDAQQFRSCLQPVDHYSFMKQRPCFHRLMLAKARFI